MTKSYPPINYKRGEPLQAPSPYTKRCIKCKEFKGMLGSKWKTTNGRRKFYCKDCAEHMNA